jgi:hypothetical protein
MKMRRLLYIKTLLVAILLAVGCSVDSGEGTPSGGGRYGVLRFGQESMPINLAEVSESGDFVVALLSPLTDKSNMTTSVIVGLRSELVGSKAYVSRLYCNDDYVVIYEDPQCYYAPFRSLLSGTISIKMEDGRVDIDLDVELYDGTPLRYSGHRLPLTR